MVKARLGDLVMIGLSQENVNRLRQGMPILFNGGDVNLPDIQIAIVYGRTEEELAEVFVTAAAGLSGSMR